MNLLDALHALSNVLFCQVLGWTKEELDTLLEEVKNEVTSKKIHMYFTM
jgi:hypothetical protein